MIFISVLWFFLLIKWCDSKVEPLTDSDFEIKIKAAEIALVEFYAPWCGHCKKLAPEFDSAAVALAKSDPPVPLYKIDCTTEKVTCEKYGINGYPALKIFRNGQVAQEYKGERSSKDIIKYMQLQSGPTVTELSSEAALEKFTNRDDHVVIGCFESDSKLKDSFFKVADTENERFTFGHLTDKKMMQKMECIEDIVVIAPKKLHNKFEPNEIRYDGNYDTDKIKDFLTHATSGLAGIRTSGNLFQFEREPIVFVYYKVDYALDPKGTSYWRNRVLKVAESYKRKVHFAISNIEEFQREIEDFGLGDMDTSEKPIVAARTKNGKFSMDSDFSVDNLKKFVEDLVNEKLEPYVKSEAEPKTQGDVKTIVARNFKKMITDVNKDVLIEFYAPWCGHCKKLAPIFDELGKKLAKEDVVIAKMDATANDVLPPFEVRGFPTIYWIPKNDKNKPVTYDGGRELKDLLKYVAKQSTDELKGYGRDSKKKKKTEL